MGKKTSEEEKLKKIVEFFEATSDVYSLKELEKKLPKSCGISGLVVKDLVQTLVSENRINSEKCGSSNLYWRFRYQEHHRLQCETERNTNAIEVLRKENERLLCEVNAIEKSIEDTDERQELLNTYWKLRHEKEELHKKKIECERYSTEQYKNLEKSTADLRKCINKITDDIFSLKHYLHSKFGIESKAFHEYFKIPEDLDYIE